MLPPSGPSASALLRFWPATRCCCSCWCPAGLWSAAGPGKAPAPTLGAAAAAASPAPASCCDRAASCCSTCCSLSRSSSTLSCSGLNPPVAPVPPGLPTCCCCCSCCWPSSFAAAASSARCRACCCTAASANASTWKVKIEECIASERPMRTIPGARRAPDPPHTPLFASRMMSSSMAALLWAHTSTLTGGTSPSLRADRAASAGRELLPSLELPCFATAARPLPAAPWVRPPPLSAAPSNADSMPTIADVLPAKGRQGQGQVTPQDLEADRPC